MITCMNAPLACSAGNALEVHEAIRFLRGDARHERLLAVVLSLSGELLHLGGLAADLETGSQLAADSLDSGRAAERFEIMVAGQGGPADMLKKPEVYLKAASVVRPVFSDQPGFISAIDTRAMGAAVVQLGGGRRYAGDTIDPSVGFSSISSLGQPVDQHTPLALIHAADEAAWERAADQLRVAIKVEPEAVAVSPVIHARVEGNH